MAKSKWKPTINIAQLIHIMYQVENLTGHSIDELIDMLFSGNMTGNVKQVFMDTLARIKDEPFEVGGNAALYALIYKLAKKQFGPMVGRIDFGFFYLKPV